MQRKYSEPNAYIDNLPKGKVQQEELYDDVDLPDLPVVRGIITPCCTMGKHLAMGESPAVEGERFPTAAKGISWPWGNPGFCNGAK